MKKLFLLLGLCLLLAPLVSAGTIEEDIVLCYDLEADGNESINGDNLTATGSVSYSTGKNGNGLVIDASGEYLQGNTPSVNQNASTDATFCFWYKSTQDSTTGVGGVFNYGGQNEAKGWIWYELSGIPTLNTVQGGSDYNFAPAIVNNNWEHYCGIWFETNNSAVLYMGGASRAVSGGSQSGTEVNPATNQLTLGWVLNNVNYRAYGTIDSVQWWDRALTTTEVGEVYNGGTGRNCSTYLLAPSSAPYAHVEVKDLYDDNTLAGLTVYEGTLSNTTDGLGVASFFNNDGLNYTIDGGTHYFDKSGTATQNATVSVSIYGAFPSFSLVNVEGALVSNFTLTSPETSNTTTGTTLDLLLPPNTLTDINATSYGYFKVETNYTAGSQDTSTNNLTGAYQSVVTINATNAYTGARLTNFTGYAYHNSTGYNYTFSDDNGTVTLPALFGNYSVYLDVSGYSLSSDNTQELGVNETAETLSFALYSENSIFFNYYDEEDSSVITANVTNVVSGASYEETFYSATGSLFVENLTDGNYTAKISGGNYTQKTYTFTVADRSSQTLNAYLSRSTSTVTFTLIDDNSFQTIEGASVSQQRLINGSWTTVGSKTSDITGRAQFIYTIGVKYRFSISASGYDLKVFELDPVIFTSYNIQLSPTQAITEEYGYIDVTSFFYPKVFLDGAENNLTVTFTSPDGSLESYGAVVESSNGTLSESGTNAYGDQLDFTFFLNNSAVTDRVNITLFYDSVYGANKTYSYSFLVTGAYQNGTLVSAGETDYGLGTVDKAVISSVSVLFGAGLVGLFVGTLPALIVGLILFGYFAFIGFLSWWFVVPVILISGLLLMKRSDK